MEPVEYLRALRRRWSVVATALGIAVVIAWLTTSVAPVGVGPPIRQYSATAVLLEVSRPSGNQSVGTINNLNTIAALTTVGEVPVRVAKALRFSGNPLILAGRVSVSVESDSGIMRIKATAGDARETERLANTFSRELLSFLRDRSARAAARQAEGLTEQLGRLKSQIARMDARLGRSRGSQRDLLVAERDAKVRQYGFLVDQYHAATRQSDESDRLLVVQEASALPLPVSGFQAPRTGSSRLLFTGTLGLIAGVVLALVLERLDTRIRTKEAAAKHFGYPVLAEVPPMRRLRSRNRAGAGAEFTRLNDAFRLLGSGLGGGAAPGADANGARTAQRLVKGHTILVTSPGASDGKTTVVAHLASTFAELGRRVLVVSCDFRRPDVHRHFDVPASPGLAEALAHPNGTRLLDSHVRETAQPSISVVPSGTANGNSAALLSSGDMRRALREARRLADDVVLDTSALLTGDATELLTEVDGVLIVARCGKTTVEQAQRASELLRRLNAPVLGVVLNGSSQGHLPRGYYRKAWLRRLRHRGNPRLA